MTKTYIEYLYPGLVCSESSTKEVKTRDIPAELPGMCFAFRFFDVVEIETEGRILKSEPENRSNWFYAPGEVLTVQNVKEKYPENKTLIWNMETNKIDKVIMTRFGQAIPLQPEDVVLF